MNSIPVDEVNFNESFTAPILVQQLKQAAKRFHTVSPHQKIRYGIEVTVPVKYPRGQTIVLKFTKTRFSKDVRVQYSLYYPTTVVEILKSRAEREGSAFLKSWMLGKKMLRPISKIGYAVDEHVEEAVRRDFFHVWGGGLQIQLWRSVKDIPCTMRKLKKDIPQIHRTFRRICRKAERRLRWEERTHATRESRVTSTWRTPDFNLRGGEI
jgi:hypothetical protein